MNRMQRARAERHVTMIGRLQRFGLFKLLGLMLLLGVLVGASCVYLIPTFVRFGLPARLADKLPYLGFAGGLLVGFSAPLSRELMISLQIGMALPLLAFALLGTALSVLAGMVWTINVIALLPFTAGLAAVFVLIVLLLNRVLGGSGPRQT